MLTSPFNMSKCRTCLMGCEVEESYFLHEEMPFSNSVIISDALKEVTHIELSDDDRFSRKICAKCCTQLKDAHSFIKQVHEVDKIIQGTLNEDYKISLPYIVSIAHSFQSDNLINEGDASVFQTTFQEVKCEPIDDVPDLELMNEWEIKKEPDCEEEFPVEYLENHNGSETYDFLNAPKIKEEPLENDFPKTEEVEHSQGLLVNHYTIGSMLDDFDDIKPTQDELDHAAISYNLNQEEKFFCDRCKEPLESKDALCKYDSAHKTSFERCMLCNKYFSTHDKLKSHVILSHTYNYEKCSKCELSFTKKKDLNIHLDSHKSIKQELQCPNCPNERFKTYHQLQSHLSKHCRKRKKSLLCDYCFRKFSNKSAVSRHLKYCIKYKLAKEVCEIKILNKKNKGVCSS